MLRRTLQSLALVFLCTSISCGLGDKHPNVLLIIVDTLRADRLSWHGYTAMHMPNIDGLASEGVRFETVVTASPVTAPSVSTILTSTYPTLHGLRDNELFALNRKLPTLASTFRAAEYATGAFVGSFVLSRRFGFDEGFDHFDDDMSEPYVAYNTQFRSQDELLEGTQRRASSVTSRALEWLEEQDKRKPFFCFVHYFDPHMLYDPPPPFNDRYATNPYDGEIAYTDEQIGVLLAGLRELGIADKTLIVFTADHGEALGEHGEGSHGFFIYDATMRVPLIVHKPGMAVAGRSIKSQVRTLDIMPTVLDLAGLRQPETVQGTSLAKSVRSGSEPAPMPAYMENFHTLYSYRWKQQQGIRTLQWKYIRSPQEELYDLRTDPHELTNVFAGRGDVVKSLKKQLRELESRFSGGSDRTYLAVRAASDPKTTQKMGALSYIGTPHRGKDALPEIDGDFPDVKDALKRWNARKAAQKLSKKGHALLEDNQDCPGAIKALEMAGRLVPANSQIAHDLSIVYERCGQLKKARVVLQDFIAANPTVDARVKEATNQRIAALRAARGSR